MCTNAICQANNQKRAHVDRIVSLALAFDVLRGQFSKGDEWTDQDDRLCIHLDAISETITETAEQLTRSAMNYRLALEAANEPQAKETIETAETDG